MSPAKTTTKKSTKTEVIPEETLLKAWELMCTAKLMAEKYEENAGVTSKYVHATSRGHEAVQLALGLQLKPQDWLAAYYRDDSILLGSWFFCIPNAQRLFLLPLPLAFFIRAVIAFAVVA